MQKWKQDPTLYNAPRNQENKKEMDWESQYRKEFIEQDPVQDWESVESVIKLWNKFIKCYDVDIDDIFSYQLLDVGSKDGQFVEWINKKYDYIIATGTDVDQRYIQYARSKDRVVVYDDIVNTGFQENSFDIIISHHVLGLCSDYKQALINMFRICKKDGYVITLNDIPGNPKKHYQYIPSEQYFKDMLKEVERGIDFEIIYFDKYTNTKEFLFIGRKK